MVDKKLYAVDRTRFIQFYEKNVRRKPLRNYDKYLKESRNSSVKLTQEIQQFNVGTSYLPVRAVRPKTVKLLEYTKMLYFKA